MFLAKFTSTALQRNTFNKLFYISAGFCLSRELEAVGIRLNRSPPGISLTKKKGGGLKFNSIVPLTKVTTFVAVA